MPITIIRKNKKKLTIDNMQVGDTFKYHNKYYITMLDENSENVIYYDVKENRLKTYYDLTFMSQDFNVELIKVDITITEL
jgi:hypothetical protein